MRTAILLVSCPDRKGLVREISDFIARNDGNIVNFDQHIDEQTKTFLARVEWDLSSFKIPPSRIEEEFKKVAKRFGMNFRLSFSDSVKNVAIFVSRQEHCLYDLMHRFHSGELKGRVVAIISNHTNAKKTADFFGVPFYHVPKNKENKKEAEEKELEILRKHKAELVVLARYMQILSPDFVKLYENRIINIHHSFLPAFPGAKPYERAFRRGVKIIGATAHYVNEELDAGPIIEQDVVRVSHKDTLSDFIRKGKDLEKLVLARAVRWHLEDKVLVYNQKTVVFEG
ncbi:MAG: formyltetrahydrofolate deformylase [Aquificae bacterium]|nr:formyltetrahydrofolate deformylase [Aquificota bacterium]